METINNAEKLEAVTIPSLQCNLAHSYLLQNQFNEAKELYLALSFEKNKDHES
ncbi:MAG: hypothetical protein U5K51_11250 [Flavobacteriaceae bacterium]|nr:hypothetical protein [Flavobacteriaceae bacterium]